MGNEDRSFDEFYTAHYAMVRRYASGRFGDDEADDIAQETMLRAWARFAELVGDGRPLTPWLVTVANGIGIDRRRRRARLVVDDDAVRDAAVAVSDQSVRVALEVDTRPLLRRALRRLSPAERTTLAMFAIAGVGIGEIAVETGLTANAVRQRLFRARRNLRRAYAHLGGQDYVAMAPASIGISDRTRAWTTRMAGRLARVLAGRVPDGLARPGAVAAVVASLMVVPGVTRLARDIEEPAPRHGTAPMPELVPRLPRVTVGVVGERRVPIALPESVDLPRSVRIEEENGGDDPARCGTGMNGAYRDSEPGASGGEAVFVPRSGCGQWFSAATATHVSAIRYRVSGKSGEICGHFEISGAIVGSSGAVCEAGGNWILVPVTSTVGVGSYEIRWFVEDGYSTELHAIVDYHWLSVAGAVAPGARCVDGMDDDSDGSTDLPADPACDSRYDDDETSYGVCDDGFDNDGDGGFDFGNDPACVSWDSLTERCPLSKKTDPLITTDCVVRTRELPEVPPLVEHG